MRENSFIYRLLFNRISKDSKQLIPELFHTDQFLRPNYTNYKFCPQCNAKAETNKQIIAETHAQAKQQSGFDSILSEGYDVET